MAEADEFDRSFLRLTPVIAVITNIDRDHLDTYGTLEAIEDAFVEFANRVPFFGRLIVCLDDPNVQKILPRVADRRIITYGFSPQADLSAVDLEPARRRQPLRRAPARRPPARPHRPRAASSCRSPAATTCSTPWPPWASGLSLRIDFDTITRALAGFAGVHRRFEQLGTWRGAAVVDDYAHHPTEVDGDPPGGAPDLPRRRGCSPSSSRTSSRAPRTRPRASAAPCWEPTWRVVTDVYPSREQPIPGVTGELVVEAARRERPPQRPLLPGLEGRAATCCASRGRPGRRGDHPGSGRRQPAGARRWSPGEEAPG